MVGDNEIEQVYFEKWFLMLLYSGEGRKETYRKRVGC